MMCWCFHTDKWQSLNSNSSFSGVLVPLQTHAQPPRYREDKELDRGSDIFAEFQIKSWPQSLQKEKKNLPVLTNLVILTRINSSGNIYEPCEEDKMCAIHREKEGLYLNVPIISRILTVKLTGCLLVIADSECHSSFSSKASGKQGDSESYLLPRLYLSDVDLQKLLRLLSFP